MNRLIIILVLLVPTVCFGESWGPFIPHDINRTYVGAMHELGKDTSKAQAFWKELQRVHSLNTKKALLKKLESNMSVVSCEGSELLTIARINVRGEISYYQRKCHVGERIVYMGNTPMFSTRCGNPIIGIATVDQKYTDACTRMGVSSPALMGSQWGSGNEIVYFVPNSNHITSHTSFGGLGVRSSTSGIPITSWNDRAECIK